MPDLPDISALGALSGLAGALGSLLKSANWRASLKVSSFRGVKFFTQSAKTGGGRRIVFHEFVGREEPYAEDLGRKKKSFSVDAYVIGDDFIAQTEAFEAALDGAGAGTLIHRYRGTLNVVVDGWDCAERDDEGRIARYSIQFAEAGKPAYPTAVTDGASAAADSATGLIAAAQNVFNTVLQTVNQSTDTITALTSDAKAVLGLVSGTGRVLAKVNSAISVFNLSVKNLQSTITSLINSPSQISADLANTWALLQGASLSPGEVLSAYKPAMTATSSTPPPLIPTPQTMVQAQNRAALYNYTNQLAIANAAQVAVTVPFATTEDAVAAASSITAAIDAQLDIVTDPTLFQALYDLKAKIAQALPGDQDLASVVEVQILESAPSLVVAYDYYGNLDNEPDLVARNDVAYPMFLAPSQKLMVLTREQ